MITEDKVTKALELFKSGYHCSQAVLAVFSEDVGISKDIAFRITCPFGGGMGGYGKTCGALTGALMVLGLKYGTTDISDVNHAQICRDKTRALIEKFEKEHGSSSCNNLVGFDRSNLSGTELMNKLPFFHNTCSKFIETVVAFLEEEL